MLVEHSMANTLPSRLQRTLAQGFFSIILLGLVDAEYKFIWVDVGANGSTSDCAVFNNSKLKEALEVDTLGLFHLKKSFQGMMNPSLTS